VNHLNWNEHIDYTYIKKLIKFTSIFYKLRNRLPSQLTKMLYFAFVHSQLSYGIEINGNTYLTYLNKLNILNNKILRLLQNARRDTKTTDLYNKFNTLTLPNLYKFNILQFFHKFFHHRDQLPPVFSSYFVQNSELHCYNTRIKDEPHFPPVGNTFGHRSIMPRNTFMVFSTSRAENYFINTVV